MMANLSSRTLDFSAYVASSAQGFTGRQWMFERIGRWLMAAETGARFFVVTGEPGSGKTTLAAYLTQVSSGTVDPPDGVASYLKQGFLQAVHFCSARDRYWINPRVFTQSMAAQLAGSVPGFAEALLRRSSERQVSLDVDVNVGSGSAVGVVIHNLNLSDVTLEDAFARFVREPLEEVIRYGHTGRIVILVDGLDEGLLYTQEVGIPELLAEAEQLPAAVRFLVTTRPHSELLRALRRSGVEEQSLSSADGLSRSLEDIQAYVLWRLGESNRLRSLLAVDLSVERLAQAVRDRSAGNFLYVRLLLDTFEAQGESVDLASLDRFPAGLDGLYLEYLERIRKKDRASVETLMPLMGALAVAREPLTEGQLAAVLAVSRSDIRRRLQSIRQLLETEEASAANERTYALFHRSFVEFLFDENRAEELWCDPAQHHRRFVDAYFVSAEPLRLHRTDDPYLWRQLPHHLYGAGKESEVRRLLTSYAWLEAKLATTGLEMLLSDYDLFPPGDPLTSVRSALRMSSHVVQEDPDQLKAQILGRLLGTPHPDVQCLTAGAAGAYGRSVALRPLTPCLKRPQGPLRQTTRLLDQAIEGLAFGPAADWLLVAGEHIPSEAFGGRNLVAWQREPSRVLFALPGHTFQTYSLVVTDDGTMAVTAGRELDKALWDGGAPVLKSPDYTPDTLTGDECLRIWDLEARQERLRIACKLDHTAPLAIAGNQVFAIDDGTLRSWEVVTGSPRSVPNLAAHWNRVVARGDFAAAEGSAPRRPLETVARSPAGWKEEYLEALMSGAFDYFRCVWPVRAPGEFRLLRGMAGEDFDITPDGTRWISIDGEGILTVVDLTTERTLRKIETREDASGSDKAYQRVSFLDAGARAVSIWGEYTSNNPPILQVWDLATGEEIFQSYGHATMVTALTTSYPRSLIATGTMNGDVKIWDAASNAADRPDAGQHTRRVNSVAVTPDGCLACSGADDATVRVWDPADGRLLGTLSGHKDRINCVAFTQDGTRILSASADRTIRIWDARKLTEEKILLGHERGVNGIAVHPDGRRILTTSSDVSLRWWDLETGHFSFLFPTSRRVHVPTQIAFDARGKRFALGQGEGRDSQLITADVAATQMVVWDPQEHDFIASGNAWHDVEAVAMSADGEFAYYTSDAEVRKIRAQDNETLFVVAHAGAATGIALLAEERYAVSVSRGGDILVWDTERGEILTRLMLDESLEACAVTPNGWTVVVGDNTGQVNLFRLEGLAKPGM